MVMRAVQEALNQDNQFRPELFWSALAINVLYMFVGVNLYLLAIGYARRHGMLMQMGE